MRGSRLEQLSDAAKLSISVDGHKTLAPATTETINTFFEHGVKVFFVVLFVGLFTQQCVMSGTRYYPNYGMDYRFLRVGKYLTYDMLCNFFVFSWQTKNQKEKWGCLPQDEGKIP